VEASALRAPAGLSRRPLALPLLRLRSDDQLLALFRGGNEEAFAVLHDRYRQRLFAYVRQMLSGASRQDAEDVMQDVFVRAYGALRADERAVNVRAWLYRVAHNRCVDHLRRPVPPAAEIYELSRKPLHDPIEEAQRREDLARLVEDVGRLPDQQRSALLMREIDGMSYADLAGALSVTVPAVKSLLVRARIGLVEAAEARDADCAEIRDDLVNAYDRGVKASGRARRHMRTCSGCRDYRTALRGMRRSFAALSPVAAGPLAIGAKLLGLGGAGGGAAAGGSAAAGGGVAAVGTVSACKVAAVVCTAALTAGGAVEVHRLATPDRDSRGGAAAKASPAQAAARAAAPAVLAAPAIERSTAVLPERVVPAAQPAAERRRERAEKKRAAQRDVPITAPDYAPAATEPEATAPAAEVPITGGAQAPEPPPEEPAAAGTEPAPGGTTTPPPGASAPPAAEPAPSTTAPGTGTQPAPPPSGTPPDEH
jgi:RNA polymerase sigma factor (sigma-70 family)